MGRLSFSPFNRWRTRDAAQLLERFPSMYGVVGSICSTSSARYGVTPALRRRRLEDQKFKVVFGRLQAWAAGDPVLGEWGGLRVSEEANRGEEPGTEPWPTFQV